MALAAVGVDVEQFPAVGIEMRPTCRRGRMHGVGEPALMPNPAGAQHRVELGIFSGVGSRIGKGRFETHAIQRFLGDALDSLRQRDVQQVIDRRSDIGDIDVGVADLAVRSNTVGPGYDCRVGDAALVRGVPLVELVGRVEGHRPADRVMVVGVRPTEVVEQLHALFDGVDVAVEEFAFVHRSVRPTLAAGAVVGDHHDDGVV